MIKQVGSIKYEDIWSDGYLIRKIYIDEAGIYKDLGLSIGIRDKWIEGTDKLIISIANPQKEFMISTREFLKEAVEDRFVGKYPNSPMKFYYFPIWNK